MIFYQYIKKPILLVENHVIYKNKNSHKKPYLMYLLDTSNRVFFMQQYS